MLTLCGTGQHRDCQGWTRRDFLQAGMLGLGGLNLPWVLSHRACAAASGVDYVRDRAVVMLFLAGGASHIETFNPNMDAPEPYRSVTGEVKTSIPGLTLGGTFPLLAKHAAKLIAVRSFFHRVGSHPQAISHVLTGGTDPDGKGKEGFSLGSMYARLRGANHPETGLPTYALLLSPHKDGQYRKELKRVEVGSRPGPLGPSFAPFNPERGGTLLKDMHLNLPAERLEDRQHLLGEINRLRKGLDAGPLPDSYRSFEQQAMDLLLGGASRAFDLSEENPRTVERYDTSMYECGKKVFQPSILGKQMLMARRLIEAGCGFVTVQSAGWDMHADGNNPGIDKGMHMLGPTVDKALSAFLEDLEQRGLRDKVLVIVTGDFGRTPKINKRGGRDHWPRLCTLGLWGGGLGTGQIVGRADDKNAVPASTPVSTPNLLATVLHALFDVGKLRIARGVPSDLVQLIEKYPPIPGVLS
jgi:hypothetical protein